MEIVRIVEKKTLGFVLMIPVLASIYFALSMPVSYDEAWTYLNFTQKGVLFSASHYPAPNNHILHSILTNITDELPFSNLINLRFSVLLVHLAALLLAYRITAKHFDQKTALVVVALSSVLFMNLYYSYLSRGYALVNLFFILALHAAFDIVKHQNPVRKWLYFGIVSVLGFYTMPSFLYPFATLNFFILYYNRKKLWPQIITNLSVITIVLLLYLPVFYNDGVASVTNNPYVKQVGLLLALKSMPFYYPITMAEITGIHWILLFALLVFSIWKMWRIKDRMNLVFSMIMIFAPLVLLSIHRVIPGARIFCYYGFVCTLIIVLPYRMHLNRLSGTKLVLGLLILQVLLVLNFNRKIEAYENKDLAANITASAIIPEIIGNHKYLFNFALLKTNLEFELVSKGYKNYTIESVNIPRMSADTINGYDYIIINKDFDRTKQQRAVFRTAYYNIYKKNQDSH